MFTRLIDKSKSSTGAEAMFADLGHFSKGAIQV